MDEFSSGLSEQQLKYGFWYASHQIMVRRVLLMMAWGFVGALLAFSFSSLADFYLLGGARERTLALRMQNDKAGFAWSRERMQPRDLSVTDTLSLLGGEGKVDFVARVKNTNAGWGVEVDYAFGYGSAESKIEHGFVLPNQSTYLASYGIPDPGMTQPVFRVKELRWMRVPAHEVGVYASWVKPRDAFLIEAPSNSFVDFGGKRITRTNFILKNTGSFSYWHVPLMMTLELAGTPVAMQEVTVDNIVSGEARTMEVSWYSPIPAGVEPNITPHINYLDTSVYMETPGAASTDIREMNIEELR